MAGAIGRLQVGAKVREVAEALGYDDPFAFSRQFKRVVGRPPRTVGLPVPAR